MNTFLKENFSKELSGTKELYDKTDRILLTINNELFFSNKFKTPLYTFSVAKSDKVEHLFRLLAQQLMVDPSMFFNKAPEGMDIFIWNDAPGTTKMTKLTKSKTIAQYGITKNSRLILKYRCGNASRWWTDEIWKHLIASQNFKAHSLISLTINSTNLEFSKYQKTSFILYFNP